MAPALRHGLELGPVLAFFATYVLTDLMTATAVIMALITLAVAVSYAIERRVAPVLLFAWGVAIVFGGLTLLLQDPFFIKIRATVYFTALAGLLALGLAFRKLLLRYVFEMAFRLDEAGWRVLTLRTIGFFLFLAALNVVVFSNFSEETWVAYKAFGQYPR